MLKSVSAKLLFIITLLIIFAPGVRAQVPSFKQVSGLQTKEIYDILIDRRGFLWIADDLGVSRYDGLNFTQFTNPQQISLAATGLTQDEQGRIWFNNFSGQIFYIENEEMVLLKDYDYKAEQTYPRITIFNHQLVATTNKGIFTANTSSLKSKYIKSGNSLTAATTSLAKVKDNVIAYGAGNWFRYKTDGSFHKIAVVGDDKIIKEDISTLSADTYHDTLYMSSNTSGTVRKLILEDDLLKVCAKLHYKSFINTISVSDDNQWVNTTTCSYSLKNGETLAGYNASNILKDGEGNQWISSVNRGLWANFKKSITPRIEINALDADDMVLSIKQYNNNLLLGTQNGRLLLYNPASKSILQQLTLPKSSGSVNNITAVGRDTFVIGSSVDTYKYSAKSNKATLINVVKSLKQADMAGDFLYIASAKGLFIIPTNNPEVAKREILKRFNGAIKYDEGRKAFFLDNRCRAVCYYPETQSLFVAFKDGLYVIDKKGINQFLYAKEPVFAASLCYANHKLYIGTINIGLLCIDKSVTKNISVDQGLLSTAIFKIRSINNKLWIIGSGPLQAVNPKTLTVFDRYGLPSREEAQVTDIAEINGIAYLTTLSGLFNFPIVESAQVNKSKSYLLSARAGKRLITDQNHGSLPFFQNNIQFKIGVPSYSSGKEIYIRYCLQTEVDTVWQNGDPGERTITFSSLTPGNYTFKAFAVNPKSGNSNDVISFSFKILPPWWRSLWFTVFVFVCISAMLSYILISYNINELNLKKAFVAQQESIKLERQRISSEIHDDIGSGLFAIQLFADLATKKRNDVAEIGQINEMVIGMADKIREIIWSTNAENDNLENLLYYIQFQVTRLFEYSGINFTSTIPDDIVTLTVSSQSRKNIFLIVKELAHNAIKHSKATDVDLTITIDDALLVFMLKDNGIGFNPAVKKMQAMGLENIKQRLAQLNGSLLVKNENGTLVIVKIPMRQISTAPVNFKRNIWRMGKNEGI